MAAAARAASASAGPSVPAAVDSIDRTSAGFRAAIAEGEDQGAAAQRAVEQLHAMLPHYDWVGIYWVDGSDLVLGPWVGPEATEHTRIPIGTGVCGAAAASGRTEIVPDVDADPRYLSCFASTKSEIVVPIFHENEVEFSAYNFEVADTDSLFDRFRQAADECRLCIEAKLPLPAYDQAIKASHIFNTLQARGVISVAERQAYIGRVRELAKGACQAWMDKNGWAA